MKKMSDKLNEWVEGALTASVPPDELEWDTAFVLLPNPQGGLQPAFILLMSIPSPILGDKIPSAGVGFNPHTLNQETINKMVSDGLTGLYKARSDALSNQLPKTNGKMDEMIGKSVEWPPIG